MRLYTCTCNLTRHRKVPTPYRSLERQPGEQSQALGIREAVLHEAVSLNGMERNKTLLNDVWTCCTQFPFRLCPLLAKPNGIELNDIGNVFLMRAVFIGLSQRSNPGTEAVNVKGAESDRSSLTVTCSGSSPTRGLTGMKYHTRNKTGR